MTVASSHLKPRLPEYICPTCHSVDIVRDESVGELVCQGCGLVLVRGLLPDRDLAEEPTSKSAALPLDFDGGLGRPPDEKTLVKLLEKGIVGDQPGFANLPIRVDELRRITVSSDAFREFVRPALQHASLKLDQIGFRNFGSMTNESRYSHVLGGNAGRLIRKFYRGLLDDLSLLGYVLPLEQMNGNGRSKLGAVVFDHRAVAENLIAFELHREAAASGDDRKLRRALGLVWSPRRKKWISRTDIPRLEFYDPRLMELYGLIVSRKVSLRNVLASLFLSRSKES